MRWQKWFTFTVYYKNNTHLRVFSFRDIVVLGHVANGLSRTGQVLAFFMLTDVVGHFTQTAGLNCQLSLEALKLSLIFMDFHRFWRISISCYKLRYSFFPNLSLGDASKSGIAHSVLSSGNPCWLGPRSFAWAIT